ncbi:acyl-CoA thioesterase [Mesorhizobium xinjiangense]|uniref:acyl-CoA thioesterase n=1 Tax=Mesorhizobium xinjiangense TaxID=2678685 RepID=UPI0018DB1054|nr:acyl-CoA thioesterase [Mesorhizobium xinjiangense]
MSERCFEHDIQISFGDCDPAGIVFYPNYFAWFDATYHAWLKSRGLTHASLAEAIGTAGTGLLDVGATFRSPATNGDRLRIRLSIAEWREKTFRLAYRGVIGERLVVEGFELRGVFMRDAEGRLRAGPVEPLRRLLNAEG